MRQGLALVFGLALATGAPPLSLWPLAWASLVGPLWLFSRCTTPAQAGWTGWIVGAGYFGASMAWIVQPFLVDAAVTGWLAPLGLLGMAGGLSLFWAAAFWAARRAGGLILLVALWTLAELARAYVLTGFPWGLVGYVLAPSPAAHWAALVGSHGLTLAALTVAALAVAGLSRRVWLAAAGGLAGTLLLGGAALQPPAPDLAGRPVVRLVQPNAPQHLKWDPAYMPVFFQRQISATSAEGAPDLIVWPESALPVLLDQAGPAFEVIAGASGAAPVALGIERRDTVEGATVYYNSLAVLTAEGQVTAVYDKHHLVPFGEYMPFPWLFSHIEAAGLAARAAGGFSAGPGPRLIDTPVGRALPLICYEAVFPQDVTAAPERPDYLLQVTNDAWFGTHLGPQQHLMQARMRVIETGLPLVRAANTGISAVIGPGGRIIAALPLNREGHIDAPLPAALAPTPYARTGDWPVFAALLAIILFSFTVRFRDSD
ncbi:MAG: apolipoprotein N-acyltransferase [Roseivivax sp.]|nr:apolipoprotein N-acyltransferase [Roseivivax sp.]